MATYAGSLPLRGARQGYFDANRLGADGGYAKRWVKIAVLAIWLL